MRVEDQFVANKKASFASLSQAAVLSHSRLDLIDSIIMNLAVAYQSRPPACPEKAPIWPLIDK